MLRKDAKGNIQITRGDVLPISVSATDVKTKVPYVFQVGDVIRISIYEKKAAHAVVLQKTFDVVEEATNVPILLTADEMKLGDLINTPTTYWYEIELNPGTPKTQTIIGYTIEQGPKTITLLPESGEMN